MKRNKIKIFAMLMSFMMLTAIAISCKKNTDDSPNTVAVESVSLNTNNISLAVGEEQKLAAVVNPTDATDKSLTWSSSSASVTVDQEGNIKAVSLGTAVITVKSNADNSKSDTCNVTVTETSQYSVSYYNNADFHNYGDLNNPTIEGQWEGYGIGDPFIMRYNGMYYLYVSTLDSENGVRAWKSSDMINWTKCTGAGLREGYVVSDTDYISRAAYAPEVYYFNGTFYMYTSPAGNGHYIYTSTHPEGPFVRVTDNLKMSIDGSVLIDDDERMWFTRASDNNGIRLHQMENMLSIGEGSTVINNTGLGNWTEGSYILKHGDTYYITYTGRHVVSDAYRISYAYANEEDIGTTRLDMAGAFREGMDLPIVLNTDNPDLRGLGHSATFLGPDMDSYYMTYHNLNNSGGPNRSLNIDRILFNGKQMSVEPTLYDAVKPTMPRFSANGASDTSKFTTSTGKAISVQETGDVFTAEFNFSNLNAITLAVNYVDANNYDAVDLNLTDKSIKLSKVVSGQRTQLASGTLVNDFSPNALHSVRYAQRPDGKVDVFFDNMRKIKDVSHTNNGGKIAYIYDGTATIGYTAFSDTAGGLSDRMEAKQATGTIGASLYLEDDLRTNLSANSGVSAVSSGTYEGANMLKLAETGNFATYLTTFNESAYWGVEMTYPKSYAGKQIRISIDNKYDAENLIVTLPDSAQANALTIKANLGTIAVWKGLAQVRIESMDGEVGFISFSFFKSTRIAPSFSHNLNTYMATGADYRTIWKIAGTNGSDGHRAPSGTRQLVYIGDSTITDFTLEVDVMLVGGTSTNSAGIIFRAGNYAASQYDDHYSIQGYYVGLNNSTTTLQRLNYVDSQSTFGIKTDPNESDAWIRVKIIARGGNFKVYLNNELKIEANDALAFTHGRLGLYTEGAEACFKNLVITA